MLLMRMLCLLVLPFVNAKPTPSLRVIRQPDTALLIQKLSEGRLIVQGKEWDARKYCNESSRSNPEQIELYDINEKPGAVILCRGSVAGEENIITYFPSPGWPKSRKVRPAKSKARVNDEVLRNTVIRLTRESDM
jgi:hypothetical protein